MRALVTGGAGFIGSHLAERLLDDGHQVRIVDCLTDYYDVAQKLANLELVGDRAEVLDLDLRTADVRSLVTDRDVVFHLAAQPGVRLSWADGFPAYDSCNVLATQRLLEACRGTSLSRFVYASSSSVYGDAERYPTLETDLPRPRSPYGVTKMAGEHLCTLYASAWQIPTVSLRYFTVYGPRQRPDMAFHRLCQSVITGDAFPLYGDGSQIRDFTFVDDVVVGQRGRSRARRAGRHRPERRRRHQHQPGRCHLPGRGARRAAGPRRSATRPIGRRGAHRRLHRTGPGPAGVVAGHRPTRGSRPPARLASRAATPGTVDDRARPLNPRPPGAPA